MKTKIEIKHWLTGSVLFEFEKENNTIKETLEEAVRIQANLRGADLRGADLRGANLRGADLWEADLRGADLRGADLWEANLRGAGLREADLRGADLRGADLRGAGLRGADLREAVGLDFWWHIHHEILYEQLTEPIKSRIDYIKQNKPKNEVDLRIKLIKPVLGDYPKTKKGWETLHKKECGCGWNGKTIFTKENGFKGE